MAYPCAAALLRCAMDQQGTEMRGSVSGDTAWELCCRRLELPAYQPVMSFWQVAQFVLYLIESSVVPVVARAAIFDGMLEEHPYRHKYVHTEAGEQTIKSRWIKLCIQGEVDAAREVWMARVDEAPVNREVECELQAGEPQSIVVESEQAAPCFALAMDRVHDVWPSRR